MGETEEFNPLTFEKRLTQLKDTQESIQSLSSWCLKQKEHHKKIVSSWLNVLKRVKVEQRLVLFYLANDVIQYSKRKNYDFVESWGLNLQKATPLVRDEKVRHKILRIFKIWEQRSVYDDEFLSDLTGLLSAGAVKKTDDDPLDFQPQQLVNKIKQCTVLEADTDLRLKHIHESHLQLSDSDALCASLKDRSNKDDVEKELNEGIQVVERYTAALQREIVAREALLALLSTANQYYSTQRGEVKVVAYAYKNFGARVRALKRKLDELIPTLPSAAPSPPARDEDVPSPGPDEDLDLPHPSGTPDDDIRSWSSRPIVRSIAPSPPENDEDVPSPRSDEDLDLPTPSQTPNGEKRRLVKTAAGSRPSRWDQKVAYNIDRTFNTSMSADGSLYNLGLSSFLTSDNPMALFNDSENNTSANKIEVINNRPNEKQDFDINSFLKTLVSNESNPTTPENHNSGSGPVTQKPGESLPGLDLLTDSPLTPNPRPPTSFYGTMNNLSDDAEAYHPEMPTHNQWNNNQWSLPPAPVPAPSVSVPMVPPPSLPVPVSHPPALPIPVSHPPALPIPVSHPPALPIPVSHASNAVSHPSVTHASLNTLLNPPHTLNPPPHALNPPPHTLNPPSHPLDSPLHTLNPPPHTLNPPSHPLDSPLRLLNPPPLRPHTPPSLLSRPLFDTPESPPPAPPPPPAPIVPVYTHNTPELPPADVDHRSLLPPPPPPPVLPLLGSFPELDMEDVDHRLLPPPPPPVTTAQSRHSTGQQDVDHRNLISLTSQPPPSARPPAGSQDQDYRVPPIVTPSDIVESVDMDLSEDEENQAMFQNRNSFNNNKVLVGGDNGKTNHENHNLRPINPEPVQPEPEPPLQPPPVMMPPMTNPFDNMPMGLKNMDMPFNKAFTLYPREDLPEFPEENSNDSAYEDDLRSRGIDQPPPEFENFGEWQQRPFHNQRFPRNWGPRTNFRAPFPPQMWPRNVPRPPNPRWMGPRPRFW